MRDRKDVVESSLKFNRGITPRTALLRRFDHVIFCGLDGAIEMEDKLRLEEIGGRRIMCANFEQEGCR